MIYTEIDNLAKKQADPLRKKLVDLINKAEELRIAIPKEDSKRLETELRLELKEVMNEQRELRGQISQVETEVFQKALAKEYGVVGNPKFDKAYAIAYSMGHSSGYSEIENYFSELVELIK